MTRFFSCWVLLLLLLLLAPSGGLAQYLPIVSFAGSSSGVDFGYNVAVQGGVIAVGAPLYNSRKGAVFVYGCSTSNVCSLGTSLTTVAGKYYYYGITVALSSNQILLVGAPGANSLNGIVYLYSCTSAASCSTAGSQLAGSGGMGFGVSVAMVNGMVVAGGDTSFYYYFYEYGAYGYAQVYNHLAYWFFNFFFFFVLVFLIRLPGAQRTTRAARE